VPAATEDRTLPVVNLEHKGAGPAKNEKADSTDFLSSIAAARQEVQILFELTQNLGNSLSLDETLSVVSVRLKRIIPYDSVAIYLVCDGVLLPKYVWGVDVHCFFSLVIPLGEGLSGWVAKHQEPIVNGNPAAELHCLGESASSTRLQSGLAVPLHGLNGMLGVLALYRVEREAFSRDHLRIVQAVSPKLAHAVENALKFQQAETSATIDSLTNLPNARSMFLHLEGELARCKREGAPLALLVCDLDGFKQVNDRFGHLEGNRVLQLVGTGIKGVCRQYDCAARMGGDEFVLVLPGLRSDDLASIRERLAEVAAGAGLTVCGEPLLSVSIGEAFYPSDAEQAEQLLAIADQRMYQMKHQHHLLRPDRETAPA
jgi:diguanylate cyclase (GGDEF)-like protein